VLKDGTGAILADGTITTTPELVGDETAFPVADGGTLEISANVVRSGWRNAAWSRTGAGDRATRLDHGYSFEAR